MRKVTKGRTAKRRTKSKGPAGEVTTHLVRFLDDLVEVRVCRGDYTFGTERIRRSLKIKNGVAPSGEFVPFEGLLKWLGGIQPTEVHPTNKAKLRWYQEGLHYALGSYVQNRYATCDSTPVGVVRAVIADVLQTELSPLHETMAEIRRELAADRRPLLTAPIGDPTLRSFESILANSIRLRQLARDAAA